MYPDSPFFNDLNDEVLISSFCTIKNKDEYLKIIKSWLCKTPNITTIRLSSSLNGQNTHLKLEKKIKTQLSQIYSPRNIPVPKVYKHLTLDMLVIEHLEVKYLDLDKSINKEVIIDCKCASAVLRGAHIYAPGVIGMTKDCNVNDKVSIYVDLNINNKCKKGFANVWESPNKHFIANGCVRLTRNELFCSEPITNGIAIEITDVISGCPPLNHTEFHLCDAMLQNLPSIVAVECLQPERHQRILDMCASPGGKTTHIASKLRSQPEVFFMATDKTPRKVMDLTQTCEKYNLENHNIIIECVDWVKPTPKMLENIREVLAQKFDAILLDAPCSATGNRPQLINKDSDKVLGSYVALQKNLLRVAVDMLKPGGILVYSTCSITTQENEGIVTFALKRFKLELIPAEPKFGNDGFPHEGIDHPEYLQRFGPNLDLNQSVDDVNNSIGFFIAKFRKKNN